MDRRRVWRVAFLLAVLVAGLPVLPVQAAQSAERSPTAGVFVQDDWEGVSLYYEWTAGSVVWIGWQQLEPSAGVYDFSAIDAWLEMLDRGGKKGAFGVMLRCEDGDGGVDACAPAWALAWDPVMANGKPRLNYLDDRVGERIDHLVAALATRYGRDERLSHIEVGLGFAGEASPCPANANVTDKAAQCAAYRERYAATPDGWHDYSTHLIATYGSQFRAAGGSQRTPLQVTITGVFIEEAERAALVNAALKYGIGLHDTELSATFLDGGSYGGVCAQDWQPGDVGYDEAQAFQSHWAPLEQYWRQLPVSFEFSRWPLKPELSLTDEENVWWGVLNALDKHAQIVYARRDALQWEDAWRYFERYAGRTERTTTDAWVALRGASDTWCGDSGDYEWFLYHRDEAAGDSPTFYGVSESEGRAGQSWQGAYSRGVDAAGDSPFLYFDLDDTLHFGGEHVAMVEVTYWDGTYEMAGASWELAYDSARAPAQVAGSVTLGGTNRWLTHPFVLVDAAFRNRLPDATGMRGNDLRLRATGGMEVRFHKVRVEILANVSGPVTPAAPTPTPIPPTPTPTWTPEPPTATPIPPTATPVPPTPTPTWTPEPPTATPAPPTATPVPPTPTATPTLPPGADQLLYHSRSNSETVRDTFISAESPDENFEASNTLVIDSQGDKQALLVFDVSNLPANTVIDSAQLELMVMGRSQPAELQGVLYALQEPWNPEEITWENAPAARDSNPFRLSSVTLAPVEVARFTLTTGGVSQALITELVQEWVSHPDQNYGVLLQGAGDADVEYYLASSEYYGMAGSRPRLRIKADGTASVESELPTATPTLTRVIQKKKSTPSLQAPASPTPASPTPVRVPTDVVIGMLPTSLSDTPAPDATTQIIARIASLERHAGVKEEVTVLDVIAYLYTADGQGVPCELEPVVRLWGASTTRPAQQLATGLRRIVAGEDGVERPVWEFAGVDYSPAVGEDALLHFFVTVDGVETVHNVATLGLDQGTLYPEPAPPERGAAEMPARVDASIEILWPQEDAAVPDADLANLSVVLFHPDTRQVLPASLGYVPEVRLHWSIDDGLDLAGVTPLVGTPRLVQTPWMSYYLWEFEDIDVSLSRQSGVYMNFWVDVEGMESRSNVWSHGYGERAVLSAPTPEADCR